MQRAGGGAAAANERGQRRADGGGGGAGAAVKRPAARRRRLWRGLHARRALPVCCRAAMAGALARKAADYVRSKEFRDYLMR